jgi:gas vesicle protein
MAHNIIRTGNYFLVGLGIGSLVGALFAPDSGAEARNYKAKKTREENKLARNKVQGMRAGAGGIIGRGNKIISQTEGRFATAIELASRHIIARRRRRKSPRWKARIELWAD